MIFIAVLFVVHFQQNEWDLLSTVDIVIGFDEFMGTDIEKPVFSSELEQRAGTDISLEGFVIPIQQASSHGYFVLSRFPYQSCFFCGAAGPETVVEVYSREKFSLMDERVYVEGKLQLNHDSPLHLFFIIKDAKVKKLN
ncbi:MAG: hypothetical protein AAGA66_09005 [Bacteroidota bacterium]